MLQNKIEGERRPTTNLFLWMVRNSDFYSQVGEDIRHRLFVNRYFSRHIAPYAVLAEHYALDYRHLRDHVCSNLVPDHPNIEKRVWSAIDARSFDLPPANFFDTEEKTGAMIELYTRLQVGLLHSLGNGESLTSLASRFIRPYQWGLDRNMPEGTINWYICFPKKGRERRGPRVNIPAEKAGAFAKYQDLMWNYPDVLNTDKEALRNEIWRGRQPLVEFTPQAEGAVWGVNLEELTLEEIEVLADSGHYCDDCRYYHANVKKLKEFGKLIAPVDQAAFGERLLERYKTWVRDKKSEEKFRVLIPAQADETTITGIFDYLNAHGIPDGEINNNFSLHLADFCPTPLLRVYAALKRRNMLEIANIESMDAFRWQERKERFDFIAADHFIDLFPTYGILGKIRLLQSLTNSLAEGGQLFLTIRCGSEGTPLTAETVMEDFYGKVNLHILEILKQLERRELYDQGDLESPGGIGSSDPLRDALMLNALLTYRQKRQVFPIKTEADLRKSLTYLQTICEGEIQCELQEMEQGKVMIAIKK